MPSEVSFSYLDNSGEKSNVRFNIASMTAANFDATHTAIIALQTAITALQPEDCLASRREVAINQYVTRTPPLLKATQREQKLLLLFEDTTLHTLFRNEIPCFNTDKLVMNEDYVLLTAGEGAALKTALEAIVKSPAGNGVSLVKAQYVGKRI